MRFTRPLANALTAAALCTTLGVVFSGTDAQAATRKVLAEKFTSIGCGYCPYIGRALHQLKDDQPNLLSYQVHTSAFGDPFYISWGLQRSSYYGVGGIPHVQFDGVNACVGSYANDAQDYNYLLGYFNNRRNVATDVTIELGALQVSGAEHTVGAVITVDPAGSAKTMRVHMVQVLDNHPYSGSDGRYFNCLMYGAQVESSITVNPGQSVDVEHTFTMDAQSYARLDETKIFLWVQVPSSSGPAEIHQAEMIVWPFPEPPDADCNGNGTPDDEDVLNCDGSPWCSDCNGNGVIDECDIMRVVSQDCNANGIPDECDFADCDGSPWCADCNENGIPDVCDIDAASSDDCNSNGMPDECEVISQVTSTSDQMSPFGYLNAITYIIPTPAEQVNDVTLSFLAYADIGDAAETGSVYLNATYAGLVFDETTEDCNFLGTPDTIIVPAATFNAAMVGYENCNVTVVTGSNVNATQCPGTSWASVSVIYDVPGTNDDNSNGIPDDCEGPACPEDLAAPAGVEQQDLNAVLNRWGDPECNPGGLNYPCPEDLATPDGVEQQDLNAVLNRWGDPTCEPGDGRRDSGPPPGKRRMGAGALSR